MHAPAELENKTKHFSVSECKHSKSRILTISPSRKHCFGVKDIKGGRATDFSVAHYQFIADTVDANSEE